MEGIRVQCEYCLVAGTLAYPLQGGGRAPGTIEIRNGKMACIDTQACDESDAATALAEKEED